MQLIFPRTRNPGVSVRDKEQRRFTSRRSDGLSGGIVPTAGTQGEGGVASTIGGPDHNAVTNPEGTCPGIPGSAPSRHPGRVWTQHGQSGACLSASGIQEPPLRHGAAAPHGKPSRKTTTASSQTKRLKGGTRGRWEGGASSRPDCAVGRKVAVAGTGEKAKPRRPQGLGHRAKRPKPHSPTGRGLDSRTFQTVARVTPKRLTLFYQSSGFSGRARKLFGSKLRKTVKRKRPQRRCSCRWKAFVFWKSCFCGEERIPRPRQVNGVLAYPQASTGPHRSLRASEVFSFRECLD